VEEMLQKKKPFPIDGRSSSLLQIGTVFTPPHGSCLWLWACGSGDIFRSQEFQLFSENIFYICPLFLSLI
jgi:hypothetical protein